MLSLIFLLVFGAAVTFLSLQNTAEVSLTFFSYTFVHLPIYFVIIGSVLTGVVMAYCISFINSISTFMLIRSQHKKIGREKMEVAELTKRVHQLELENAGLQSENTVQVTDKNAL